MVNGTIPLGRSQAGILLELFVGGALVLGDANTAKYSRGRLWAAPTASGRRWNGTGQRLHQLGRDCSTAEVAQQFVLLLLHVACGAVGWRQLALVERALVQPGRRSLWR